MRGKGFKAGLGRSLAVFIAVTVMFLASCKPAPTTPPVLRIAGMCWQSNVPVINIMKIVLEDELGIDLLSTRGKTCSFTGRAAGVRADTQVGLRA